MEVDRSTIDQLTVEMVFWVERLTGLELQQKDLLLEHLLLVAILAGSRVAQDDGPFLRLKDLEGLAKEDSSSFSKAEDKRNLQSFFKLVAERSPKQTEPPQEPVIEESEQAPPETKVDEERIEAPSLKLEWEEISPSLPEQPDLTPQREEKILQMLKSSPRTSVQIQQSFGGKSALFLRAVEMKALLKDMESRNLVVQRPDGKWERVSSKRGRRSK